MPDFASPDFALYEELDDAVNAWLALPDAAVAHENPMIGELLGVAAELRTMPRPAFRNELRVQLMVSATGDIPARGFSVVRGTRSAEMLKLDRELKSLPSLFSTADALYPMHGRSLATSFLLHTVALGLVLASGTFMIRQSQMLQKPPEAVTDLIAPADYVPSKDRELNGGGGGGDRDKLPAPAGKLPKASMQQITPPMMIRNEHPQLAVQPTVVLPPNTVKLPDLAQLGDPMSHIVGPASNGVGSRGGIGTGGCGGIGAGFGPGVGPGRGGGCGGGVYVVGGGVSAPRAIFSPDPEYSPEARQAKFQGTVLLWAVIGPDGRPRDVKISRSLGMGLDQKAIEAVRNWRFAPARKDGVPVAVQINIEVNFHLY
jgi:TonB family protein